MPKHFSASIFIKTRREDVGIWDHSAVRYLLHLTWLSGKSKDCQFHNAAASFDYDWWPKDRWNKARVGESAVIIRIAGPIKHLFAQHKNLGEPMLFRTSFINSIHACPTCRVLKFNAEKLIIGQQFRSLRYYQFSK